MRQARGPSFEVGIFGGASDGGQRFVFRFVARQV